MNGRKYKVSIRVVDHPPRYCDDWKAQQRSRDDSNVKVHTSQVESKPVHKSGVTLRVSDEREKFVENDPAERVSTCIHKREHVKADGKTADSFFERGMSQLSTWECIDKPLAPKRITSLNIYKLTRSNALVDQECFHQDLDRDSSSLGPDTEASAAELSNTSRNFRSTTNQSLKGLRYSDKDCHGVGTRRNGFNVHPPVVVINSGGASDIINSCEPNLFLLNDSTRKVMGDGLSSDCSAADLVSRPRLNREGSACSSDSIITEIEALTDDESGEINDVEMCAKVNQNEQSLNEECVQKTNNWRKIRGMIHWTPFAKSYKKKYPWVQLAGHQGNFKAGELGTILKKTNVVEKDCLVKLMKDVLRPYVPEFKREVESHEDYYLVMEDLLYRFESPSVMDCKMGVRTFLEDELQKARQNPELRKDLYQKMLDVEPDAPTEEERRAEAISKPRYMAWREDLSSSSTLGFRIEGIKKGGEKPNKDFKTTRSKEDLCEKFRDFINDDINIKLKYLQRLKAIRAVLESSSFFRIHEVIGSSLLFVHDCRGNVNIWLIDFAKTRIVHDGLRLTHRDKWKEGNHEDGYLFGLDNMISIWSNL